MSMCEAHYAQQLRRRKREQRPIVMARCACGCGKEFVLGRGRKYAEVRCRNRVNQQPFRVRVRKIAARMNLTRDDATAYLELLRNDPCAYCGGPGGHIDHIVPRSGGGGDDWDNLTSACGTCNVRKHNHSLLWWLGKNRAIEAAGPIVQELRGWGIDLGKGVARWG